MRLIQCVMAIGIHVISNIAFAQQPANIELPLIYAPDHKVYIATNGMDHNTGDSLHPVSTFSAALDKLDSLTNALTGDVYAEVVFYPGTYAFAAEQHVSQYEIGTKRLNVGVRGKGVVELDGKNISLSPGSAMISLKGSHIKVQNIKILYSSSNGVNFGHKYNGKIIDSHDILVDNVEVQQTAGHGIIGGIGRINAANPFVQVPYSERFWIRNCHVHHAVNYQDYSATQWGSAIKLLNVKHGTIEGCTVHDNAGEGIGLDFCHSILVQNNTVYENRANIYLDKAENCIIRSNLNYYMDRVESGILLSMEVISSLINSYYLRDIYIYNNIILNAEAAISFWQGTVSALQNAYFDNVNIQNNTIVGKPKGAGGLIRFSYMTAFGQPAGNIHFSNLSLQNNIISAHRDSLTGNVVSGPLNPQPALDYSFNLWSEPPGKAFNAQTDRIDSLLPTQCDPNDLSLLIPDDDGNSVLVMAAPADTLITTDFLNNPRHADSTNVGAFERTASDTIDVCAVRQTIHLTSGWNLISSYVNPDNPDMAVIFSDIVSDILLVKNNSGQAYLPSLGINTIGNWEVMQGYKVKVSGSNNLAIGCTRADPQTPIPLPQGWSTIAYLHTANMNAETALSNIAQNIILVKNINGDSYIPSFGINTVGDLLPGQGYQIKMNTTDTLYYPPSP